MANLISSFNAVAPICLVVLMGMLFRRIGLMPDTFMEAANRFLHKIIMPVMVFNSIYFADRGVSTNAAFPLYAVVAIIVGYTISTLISLRVFSDRRRASASAQAMIRSNYLVVGISMATTLMGDEAISSIALLTPFTTSVFALGANIIFALLLQGKRIQLSSTLKSLLSTPLLWGVFLALILMMLPFKCPFFIQSAVKNVAGMASPFALLMLGAQLDLSMLGKNLKPVLLCSLGRLIFFPVILFLPAVLWMDFNRFELAALFFLFFSPGAVNGYFEAIAKNADYEFGGEVVVMSTLLSFLTIFCSIFIFKQLGVF